MHKKIIVVCVVLALCVLGTLAGIAYAASNDGSGDMRLAGQYFKSANAEKPFSSSKNAQIVAEYNGHKITAETVAYQKNMNILRDTATAAKYSSDMDVIQQIVKSMILLEEAEKLGLAATEAEINEMVENAKLAYSLPEGKELLDAYCAGAGITIDEYFDLIRAQAPDVIARQKLKNEAGRQYCESHGLTYSNVNPPEGMLEAQEAYMENLFHQHEAEIQYYIGEASVS